MQSLCAEINRRGRELHRTSWTLDVNPRAIERWTQDGFLPQPARGSAGRGKGRTVEYDDRHIELALAIRGTLNRRRSLDLVAFELFLSGQPVPMARVRRAFHTAFDQLVAEVSAAAAAGDMIPASPVEAADEAEPTIAKKMLEASRGTAIGKTIQTSDQQTLTSFEVSANVLAMLALEPTATVDASPLTAVLGVPELLADPGMSLPSLAALRHTLDNATDTDLFRGRTLAVRAAALPFTLHVDTRSQALMAIGMLQLDHALDGQLEAFLDLATSLDPALFAGLFARPF